MGEDEPRAGPRDPAERFASTLADDPASRRARHLRAYGPPRRRTDLIWLGIALAGALVFVAIILAILDRTRATAGPEAPRGATRGADLAPDAHGGCHDAFSRALPCSADRRHRYRTGAQHGQQSIAGRTS
jgi:hypothetical protein